MQEQQQPNIYKETVHNIKEINAILNLLPYQLDDFQSILVEKDYLELLGNLLYTLNSFIYCYCQLNSQNMPSQMKVVKQYYMKIKQLINGNIQNKQKINRTIVLNKQVANRLIKKQLYSQMNQQ